MTLNLDKTFYSEINKIISNQGYIFGPSQIALLIHGPLDKKRFSSENLHLIKEREIEIEQNYQKHILPKIHLIVSTLSNFKANFPKRNDLESKIKVIPFDELRDETKHFFREYGDIVIDTETKNNLLSNRKMKPNKYVNFGFDFKHGFIFASRLKQNSNTSNKFKILYDALSEEDKMELGEFILSACKFSRDYWEQDCQDMMCHEFSPQLNKLMINDYLGLKIVEFNQNRAEKNIDRIANIGPSIKTEGFIGINKRFNDHRARKSLNRPGGVHFTFVDSGHINYPLEVQYLDSESFILDMFGPNSHDLYSFRDKKRNPLYK